MSEPQDPLRTLFRQAGAFGQARAGAAPVARVAERGRRARRRRLAALAAGACLAVAGCGVLAAGLLPGRPTAVAPAVSPSTGPSAPARSGPPPHESPPPDADPTRVGGGAATGTREPGTGTSPTWDHTGPPGS
ncbi:hypothetical protein [Streptomyces marincola]|uniref:hypothetical protein n=1 Tax=Streptomyces marincola TaxID=2878388 RepID=UPI001CF3B49A|nr:hypothetical protein [Streptomyces marincola]UCM90282.1 hypothetical protein LC193_21400 [Streptomyces marincola]